MKFLKTIFLCFLLINQSFPGSVLAEEESDIKIETKSLTGLEFLKMKALEENDPAAQFILGQKLLIGDEVGQNVEEGIRLISLAAKQHHQEAMLAISFFYSEGEYFEKDEELASLWKDLAAWIETNKNEVDSMRAKDGIEIKYIGNPPPIEKLKSDAENFNSSEAWFRLGLLILKEQEDQQNVEEGVEYIKRAAEQGHINAQKMLGGLYLQGERIGLPIQQDSQKAFRWMQLASKTGDSEAFYNLSLFYKDQAYGFSQDPTLYVKNLELAAVQDHVISEFTLGHYYLALNFPDNAAKGLKWLKRAACHGIPLAQVAYSANLLMVANKENRITTEVIKESYFWYRTAKDDPSVINYLEGNKSFTDIFDQTEERLSKEEKESISQLVDNSNQFLTANCKG